MDKANKRKISQNIENAIWEAIKRVSDPVPFDWEVTFKKKEEDITLSDATLMG